MIPGGGLSFADGVFCEFNSLLLMLRVGEGFTPVYKSVGEDEGTTGRCFSCCKVASLVVCDWPESLSVALSLIMSCTAGGVWMVVVKTASRISLFARRLFRLPRQFCVNKEQAINIEEHAKTAV